MSNTSDISPYDASVGTGGGAAAIGACAGLVVVCAAGAFIGAAALAQWLAQETPEDRAAVDRLQEELRRDRIKGSIPTQDLSRIHAKDLSRVHERPEMITTVNLHMCNLSPLVETARKSGYRLEPLVQPHKPLSEQPQILLRNDRGERLVIQRNEKNRLAVSTAGGRTRIESLVHRHSIDRAMEHLRSSGMNVEIGRIANGEVQIIARERTRKRGGAAELKAQVRKDGRVQIDVDKIQGNRCEEIVTQLAEAIGAEVSGVTRKEAYYQLPGEPAKTHARVSS